MPGHVGAVRSAPTQSGHARHAAVRAPDAGHAPLRGNRELHQLLKPIAVQPKLTLSQPDDPAEREADDVADQVMRMPGAGVDPITPIGGGAVHRCAACEKRVHRAHDEDGAERDGDTVALRAISTSHDSSGATQVRRACAKCEEEASHVQRQAEGADALSHTEVEHDVPDEADAEVHRAAPGGMGRPTPTAALETAIDAQRGGGQPLPAHTRASFEDRFGADFGQVRIHADSRAAEAASSINARAFTVGHDISFGSGQFSTDSPDGQRLLAHELTHVVQQKRGTVSPRLMLKRRAASGRRRRRRKPIDLATARAVMSWVMQIINKVNPGDHTGWQTDPAVKDFRDILSLWDQLTYGKTSGGRAVELDGEEYLIMYEAARASTEPFAVVAYRKGDATLKDLIAQKYTGTVLQQFDRRADSARRVLELLESTVSFWAYFDPAPADIGEFLKVATRQNSRAVPLQRGSGVQFGTVKAGTVYYASQSEAREVLWASPEGVFYQENGELFKQSLAGFSNDIVLGAIIKAAQDVAPFVSLMTAVLDIAISLTPVGWVYDLTNAARAALEGRWKDAALEILPGPAIAGLGKVAKLAKATKVGRAAVKAGTAGFRLVGKAVRGVKTFVAKGLARVRGKISRGMWLVTEGSEAAGKKGYYFMDEADDIWRAVDEDDAVEFITCSRCNLTAAGKGEAPHAPTQAEAPKTSAVGEAAEAASRSDILSKLMKIDKTKPGALKELAGKIHGVRAKGTVGQAVAIVEVEVASKVRGVRRVRYVASGNASARLDKGQRQLLDALGIEIAPRVKGVTEVAHAEPHIEAWVKRLRAQGHTVQVRRWGISAGERGAYICAACRQLAKDLGGVIEEFSATGKTY